MNNQLNFIDILEHYQQENTNSFQVRMNYSLRHNKLRHKTHLNKFKRIESIQICSLTSSK